MGGAPLESNDKTDQRAKGVGGGGGGGGGTPGFFWVREFGKYFFVS